jgi:predicted acetyltransferase
MAGTYRKFDPQKDRKAVHRIWQECGWIDSSKKDITALDRFVRIGSAYVYDMDGEAEALTLSAPAVFHHTGTPLSLAAITAVNTSRIARNQGAATGTLARALDEAAGKGVALAGLGCFEQGFYDRLGFGTGSYVSRMQFDPTWLKSFGRPAVPVRLGKGDWKAIHEGLLRRRKMHGAVDLESPDVVRCELEWDKNVFGLGYRNRGKLTHFFLAAADDVEEGPYRIGFLSYQTMEQLKELLALIRGLGDQVRTVRMHEPPGIQMQTLLRKPFQLQTLTRGGKYPTRLYTDAYWQLRMLDPPKCVAALQTATDVAFNLTLKDPVEQHLPRKATWKGAGGAYTVRLGPTSTCTAGHTGDLPGLSCSVNDFTRFWMGSATAEVLAGFGTFRADEELIRELDLAVRLPKPVPDWDY